MTIKLSGISGGGGLPKLAPDLDYPNRFIEIRPQRQVIVSIPSPGVDYATVLSLTGKFVISSLQLTGLINEFWNFRLTIDGVVIWDAGQGISNATIQILGGASTVFTDTSIICDSSFLFEVRSTTDTSIFCNYAVRPIL